MTADHQRPSSGDSTLASAEETGASAASAPRHLLVASAPYAPVADDWDDDLPPFDYSDEGADVDPLFAELNQAMWTPAPPHEFVRENVGPAQIWHRSASSTAPDVRSSASAAPGPRQGTLALLDRGRPPTRALPTPTDSGTASGPARELILQARTSPTLHRPSPAGPTGHTRCVPRQRWPLGTLMAVAIGCLYISSQLVGQAMPALGGLFLHICLLMGCWRRSQRFPRPRRSRV
ncbi:hypothetical protein M2164_000074 [Streptomyces sp. SAI-208]|nr:hypothetical protein [Streptomyces sp. SAI-208]